MDRRDCAGWCDGFDCENCEVPEATGPKTHYNPPAPESQLLDLDDPDLWGVDLEEEEDDQGA